MDHEGRGSTVNLSKAGKAKLIGSLALLGLAGLGWVFILGPQTGAVAEVHEQVDAANEQNEALARQIKVLRAQEAALEDVRKTASALAAKFPHSADQPEMFREITLAAVAAGIPAGRVSGLAMAAPVAGTPGQVARAKLPGESGPAELAAQHVTVSVEGSPRGLEQMMRNLEQMRRAYLVTSFAVGQGTGADVYRATISGEMFVMPAVGSPSR